LTNASTNLNLRQESIEPGRRRGNALEIIQVPANSSCDEPEPIDSRPTFEQGAVQVPLILGADSVGHLTKCNDSLAFAWGRLVSVGSEVVDQADANGADGRDRSSSLYP
jgi:hypothetical protein